MTDQTISLIVLALMGGGILGVVWRLVATGRYQDTSHTDDDDDAG